MISCLGERQPLGVIAKDALMNWSDRPHVYWIDEEWVRFSEVVGWLDEHGVDTYEALLPGFREFIIPDDTARVAFQLRFCI